METRKWQDKEGKERYTTEVIASEMKMLGSRQGAGDRMPSDDREPAMASEPRPAAAAKKPPSKFEEMDDDIPF